MSGTLYGLGVGPGDPELMTLKADRILRSVPVVAYPAPDDGDSFARSIVSATLSASQLEIPIVVPMKAARFPAKQVYDQAASTIGSHLDSGSDIAVLCEGDPFFYGSFMYLYERLAPHHRCEIVPGVSSLMASAAMLGRPLAARNEVLTVIPAPLPDAAIRGQVETAEAVAFIKVGRHFARLRALLAEMGLADACGYVERATLAEQKVMPLAVVTGDTAPYFSIVLLYKGAEGWVADL